jgi:hypothetical protein
MQSQEAREKRRDAAEAAFPEARALAASAEFRLLRHSVAHYQLWSPDRKWLLNIYPGNRRLFHDKEKSGPYLRVPDEWTLLDVVQAAIRQGEE